MLVTAGIVTAWCFGREFVDGTVAGLFGARYLGAGSRPRNLS